MNSRPLFFLFLATVLVGCNATKPWYHRSEKGWSSQSFAEYKPEHIVYLIGDAGEPQLDRPDPNLTLLKNELSKKGISKTVAFLGDNLYYNGLPDSSHPDRLLAIRRLIAQLDVVKGQDCKTIFIGGNHDWHRGKEDGIEYLRRQEQFIEQYLGSNVFLPDSGCPGPMEIQVNEGLVIILMDTQWWLHKHRKPGVEDGCEYDNDLDILLAISDMIKRNQDKQILVLGHHPLMSRGLHGGKFPAKDHLFPLRAINKKLWIPLPVLGSLYPSYRKYIGNIQDIPHPRYQQLVDGLMNVMSAKKNIIYACGHEHSIQYTYKDSLHHIISGSGSKHTYAKRGGKAGFLHDHVGFVRLLYFKNGEIRMEIVEPDEKGNEIVVFKKNLTEPLPKLEAIENRKTSYKDSIVEISPAKYFKATGFKKAILGRQYRDIWQDTIAVRMLDINYEKGGLSPIKKGGGMATKSLRLIGGDGKQYVLRSVQKYPEKAIPKILRRTFAADVVKDQISSAHPYGALAVPDLADAAGVYHTNPDMVVIPDDPGLGVYRSEFAGMLAIFEERVESGHASEKSFGECDEIISSFKLIDKLQKSHKHKIDQRAVAKARVFDMLLGDWDRHEDQWRWAMYDQDSVRLYRPIPRDRDQVFYKVTGFLPNVSNRKWTMRKFQDFDFTIRDIDGLGFNARYFDRTFLNELPKDEWLAVAKEIQDGLTDDVLNKTFDRFPDREKNTELYDELIAKLKVRRNDLHKYAGAYYEFLAIGVDVVGTDHKERIEVTRIDNNQTRVKMYTVRKDGEFLKYDRTFTRKETKEVRIYALDGKDEFEVKGKVKKGIIVRMIGGHGKDVFHDSSKVSGLTKRTKIYDKKNNKNRNKIVVCNESRVCVNMDDGVNNYDRKAFKYDFLGPMVFFGFNVDDGLFLGGGVLHRTHGFRKSPYKSSHTIIGNYAANSGAFNFKYKGNFMSVMQKWDLSKELMVNAPRFQSGFFGIGNETKNDATERSFNWLRINQGSYTSMLRRRNISKSKYEIGWRYEYHKPELTAGRFVATPEAGLTSQDFVNRQFTGPVFRYTYESAKRTALPTRGVRLNLNANSRIDITANTPKLNHTRVESQLAVFTPLRFPFKSTIAARWGGTYTAGDYPFYLSNFLSGVEHIRGFRKNRFAGQTVAYQNIDWRIKLFDFRTYIFPGQAGIFFYGDLGRVWVDGENSKLWHYGTGGGIYISPFHKVVFTSYFTVSDDDRLFNASFGFLF